ncbi:MAG TPA: hypothetical protein VGC54_12950, partial [Planctomycetota bacterium]
DWSRFDVVVIRSPWDYQDRPQQFLAVLAEIERQGARLENPLELVRWNLDKGYLRELAARGVPIVPTVWRDRLTPGALPGLFAEIGAEEIVIKPRVGANADGAFRIDRAAAPARVVELEAYYAGRALQAQPFLPAIVAEGEFSLFWFAGESSHAILKTPAAGDFRVQEEHGGLIRAVPPEPALRAAGARALAALGPAPLYARADFVRAAGAPETFLLMEFELIEPALYLRMDPGAPEHFARALDAWMEAPLPH